MTFVDFADLAAVEKALRPHTRMLWVETPTNPMLKLIDLKAIAALAKTHHLIAVADNTFCNADDSAAFRIRLPNCGALGY